MECSRTQGEIIGDRTLFSIVCRNGPVGSVVCVYTLDHMSNDVTRVFRGDYLSRVSTTTTWERADNDNPFTVSIM